jgi:hypothetical protein
VDQNEKLAAAMLAKKRTIKDGRSHNTSFLKGVIYYEVVFIHVSLLPQQDV